MHKYQKYIFILSFFIIVISVVLIYVKFFESKIVFTLFGDEEVVIYEGNEYKELGYIAISEDGDNVSNKVKVKSNLNVNKVGTYKIKYSVRSLFKVYKKTRTIKVLQDNLKEVNFTLNGSSMVNIKLGSNYSDPKFSCYLKSNKQNLDRYVKITSNLNNKKEGVYEIKYTLTYNGKTKELSRKVYVYKETISYTLSTTALTNKPVTIKFRSNIHNFAYVILPNDNVIYKNEFSYNFYENNKYTFFVFDSLNNYETYTVNIDNIDKTPPSGTCKIVMKNGTTDYTVTSRDEDISKYVYNNEEKYTSTQNTYKVSTYLRNDMVLLVDKAGNKTKVKCDVTKSYEKVIKPSSKDNVVYSSTSDSLVVNIVKKDGYYLSRIWMKDPYLQVKKEMLSSNAKKLALPKNILEQAINKYNLKSRIVLGGNASGPVMKGSHYSYVAERASYYNLKEPSALLVYNGNIIINDYKTYAGNTTIYYINGQNQLSYIPVMENNSPIERKIAFENAISSGIYNTFAFNPMLVINGKVQSVSNDYYALRNGFCQINENNFIWVVSDTKKWNKPDFAKFMGSLGCVNAANFDGGGSVALFYKEKFGNIKTLTGNGRSLSSVIYFTELS
mgnify:FL=1